MEHLLLYKPTTVFGYLWPPRLTSPHQCVPEMKLVTCFRSRCLLISYAFKILHDPVSASLKDLFDRVAGGKTNDQAICSLSYS